MADTEVELARLAKDEAIVDQLIWTEYFFSHFSSGWQERQAFRDALRAAGFTGIGSTEELSGDGYWHHYSHTIRPADPDELRAADRAAATIAEACGVRYDEWMVGRDHNTDELRPASSADIDELMKQDERSFRLAEDPARRPAAEPDD